MAAAPKPSGGRKPGQFGTTELRLGRASGIGEFFEQFNQQQMLKIQNFYRTQPIIQHEINYTCEKCSGEENVILRGLQDFLE